jgi:putative nucleotidyltransferase with HDIG domain
MLKRIDKTLLRSGMFIEDLEGSWSDNPFSNRRFLLDGAENVEKLKRSNVSGIIINTSMGLDALDATSTGAPRQAARKPQQPASPALSFEERQKIAAQAILQSEAIVAGLFKDVRSGGEIKVAQVTPVVKQISGVMRREPLILLNLTRLKSKDETTFVHSIAVSALMVQFARYLKLDEKIVQVLGVGGLLHDVGKMKIPDDVLTKEGQLTDGEFQLIRNHPELGYAILSLQSDMPEIALDVCLNHHERLDGKGYPNGKAADQLSLYARICSICDVYEAITSVRPYKQPWKHADAIAWMLDRQGHFDRTLLREFVSSLEMTARNHAEVR